MPSMAYGVEKVTKDPKYAFFSSSFSVYKHLGKETCKVQGVHAALIYLTFYMKKGFPYTEIFSHQ